MAHTCTLAVTTQCRICHFTCEWSKANPVKGVDGQRHESLDVVLYLKKDTVIQTEDNNGIATAVCFNAPQGDDDKGPSTSWGLTPEITRFLVEALDKCNNGSNDDKTPIVFKFILSRIDGYLARSDFLEQRLDGVKHVAWVVGVLRPRQEVTAPRGQIGGMAQDLSTLLSMCVGAVLLDNGYDLPDTLHSVEEALCNRISYPWVVPTPIPPERLAWVEGRKDADASRRMYEAAAALGIALVIIDKPGHWLQNDHGPYAHLREGFIATNIDVDEGFVDRMVTAVRSYEAISAMRLKLIRYLLRVYDIKCDLRLTRLLVDMQVIGLVKKLTGRLGSALI
ncbi:hypothetical protein ASPBRDRAFT_195257 [Aspergillus brasiliensis CBS 101740]|uniref:BL00235/CARNS1 N-terminal domain-containing protein n=1 Tax=Aspergillus brasiliensis (strain CBS 101740 / IMI 381727 / IBT 21946) TaxID=767769 RepID=A0A1L9ULM4_ASPBC|nr:hypothetical protein ASPBRDRAFT_195257 [Aspergillus brasiliensis CBS 101740]